MQYDFVSVGDVTTDAFIQLKDAEAVCDASGNACMLSMRLGDKIPYERVDIVHGVGNAGNAAVAAAHLGLTSALVSHVGSDENGRAGIAVWERAQVHTEFVTVHPTLHTHYHFVLRLGAERTILIKHELWPYAFPTFTEPPQWLYLTSTGEHGEAYHHEIAAYLHAHPETKLAFQPGTFQIQLSAEGKIPDIYAATEIFFCNKEEAQRILNTGEDDILTLMRGIKALGPRAVSVTDGPRGAYALNDTGAWMVPMYPDPKPPISRTGAGDAYATTVTSMLAVGMSLSEALIRGPINSMAVVQEVGAQTGLLSRESLESYLAHAPAEYALKQLA